MSRENVEAVRRLYDEWGRGNLRAVPPLDRYVIYIDRVIPGTPVAVGPDEVADLGKEWLKQWSRVTLAAEEAIDAGETVVVAVLLRGVGKGSGAPTEGRFFHVWTFRCGRVIRIDSFPDRSDALEAVGLRE